MEYGGQYETPCSRISRFGAFSGCCIGPARGVPPLRLRTLWLRLPSSVLPSSLLRPPSSLPPPSPLVSLLKKNFGIASTGRSVSLRNLADLKQRVCRLAVQIPVSVLHVAIRKNHEIIRVDCPRNAVNSAADLLFHKAVLFAGVKINAFSIRLDYW